MSSVLGGLVYQMSQNESLKTKCVAIAANAFGTCGDRVALSYVNMLLAQNMDQNIGQTPEQLFEYAKKETITNFLNEKAEQKVQQIKTRGGVLDEIETHLAYLQAAPRLGFELPNAEMIYRACSNASEADLYNAVAEFNSINIDERVANHVFDDSELRKHPKIEELISNSATKFDTELQQGETSAQYNQRLKDMQTEAKESALQSISQFFQESRNVSSNSASSSLAENLDVSAESKSAESKSAESLTQISAPNSTINSVEASSLDRSALEIDSTQNPISNSRL